MATDVLEVEWQYAALDTRPVVRWLRGPMPAGYSVEAGGIKELNDAYFDTEGWHVHRAGYTCRVRRKGSVAELTLKGMSEASGGMRSRRELTETLESPETSPIRAPGACGAILRAVAGRNPLRQIFSVHTRREIFNLSDADGVLAEIAVDETTIPVAKTVRSASTVWRSKSTPTAWSARDPSSRSWWRQTAWWRRARPSSNQH
jgi:hypothetical protein